MSEATERQERDESNIQHTREMSVDAEITFEFCASWNSCSESLIDVPDAALRLHDDLHLLEIVAKQDEAEATAGVILSPTDARRLATRLLSMGTDDFLEELETERSWNGCTRIEISDDCTAYSYDDEQDSIVAGEHELTVAEAEQLRDDLDVALEALSDEAVRR
jgi:hypothetical protein